jgi:hypothetical protein
MYAVAVIPPLIGFRGSELDSGHRARLDFGPVPRHNPAHGLTLCFTLGAGACRWCPFASLPVMVRALGWLALLARSDAAKVAEILVLRARSCLAAAGSPG